MQLDLTLDDLFKSPSPKDVLKSPQDHRIKREYGASTAPVHARTQPLSRCGVYGVFDMLLADSNDFVLV